MFVIGFDLGTVTGAASGMAEPNAKPLTWTWNLEDAGHGHPARFALFQVFLQSVLGPWKDLCYDAAVFYEKPLTFGAMMTMAEKPGATPVNDNSVTIARGLAGILEATAFNLGLRKIEPIDARQARKFFTRHANASKDDVADHCARLGWKCANQNESDACAVWAAGCAIAAPKFAAMLLPSAR